MKEMINAFGTGLKELLLEPVVGNPPAAPLRNEQTPKVRYNTDSVNNSIGRPLLMATLSGLGSPLQVFHGMSTFDRAPLPKPRPQTVISDDPLNKIYGDPPLPLSPKEGNKLPEETGTANLPGLTKTSEAPAPAIKSKSTTNVVFSAATQAYTAISQILTGPVRGSQVNVVG